MTVPGAFERAVDRAVDGLLLGIQRIPGPLIGVCLGLGLGWLVSVVANAGPVDFMSEVECEAQAYNLDTIPAAPLEQASAPALERAAADAASTGASTPNL